MLGEMISKFELNEWPCAYKTAIVQRNYQNIYILIAYILYIIYVYNKGSLHLACVQNKEYKGCTYQ